MRTWRGSVRFAFAALVGLFSVDVARAQLLIVTPPGKSAVAFAELAYAEGAGAPVTWLSLRVQRGPVAIVAALPAAARVGSGLDAWLAALEATASPNILPPQGKNSCFQSAGFAHVAWPRARGVAATELTVPTSEDALAVLDGQGLELADPLPKAERYLIWSWAAADADQTTRTLRIVGGAAPLTLLPGAPFPILVSSVTRGSMALPSELGVDELSVTFVAEQRARSDYRDRLQEFLSTRSESLLETRARGPLFDWSLYADAVSLAPLMRNYASIAQKERPGLDDASCAEQLGALRDAGAPSPAACGDALDAALALSAAGSEQATLQRFAVSGVSGFRPGDATEGGAASSPVLRAHLLDESACPSREPTPITPQPPARGRGGDASPSGNDSTVVVEESTVVDDTPPAEMSCGSSPQPYGSDERSRDSCSSDSSSSSAADDTDSGCSSDSSGSGTSDDSSGCSSDSSGSGTSDDSSGCSSDSSGSGTSDDSSGCSSDSSGSGTSDDSSGCSSDTSSTSSDTSDTSCDGGSDRDGYDGDTCTGAAAPGAEPTEKARASLASGSHAPRRRRAKTSLWTMAAAALVLPIRRRKRRLGSSG